MMGSSGRSEPYGVTSWHELKDVDLAMSNIMHSVNATPRPIRPLDGADEAWYVRRWKGWFAEAATGSLRRPGGMPET